MTRKKRRIYCSKSLLTKLRNKKNASWLWKGCSGRRRKRCHQSKSKVRYKRLNVLGWFSRLVRAASNPSILHTTSSFLDRSITYRVWAWARMKPISTKSAKCWAIEPRITKCKPLFKKIQYLKQSNPSIKIILTIRSHKTR